LEVGSTEYARAREGQRVNDRLLTTREVAKFLGLSPETVLRRYRAGELPAIRLGSNVLRFRESELEAWLDARTDRPTPLVAAEGGAS